MVDECEGCVKQIFADNWVDFINDYVQNHPEFLEAYKEFKSKPKYCRCGDALVSKSVKGGKYEN
jgi:hypothetical protein